MVSAAEDYYLITGYPLPPPIFGIIELSMFWSAKSVKQKT